MSALGQKRTYAAQHSMSALHPIATAKADIGKPSGLLYPRKRTCAVQLVMSALGQKRTLGLPTSKIKAITSWQACCRSRATSSAFLLALPCRYLSGRGEGVRVS